MDTPGISYEIRVDGHLSNQWSDWFEGLTIHADPDGETTLSGHLPDQAALIGVLTKLQALNLTLISVKRGVQREMEVRHSECSRSGTFSAPVTSPCTKAA